MEKKTRKYRAQKQRDLEAIEAIAFAAFLFAPEIKLFIQLLAEQVQKEKDILQGKEESRENA